MAIKKTGVDAASKLEKACRDLLRGVVEGDINIYEHFAVGVTTPCDRIEEALAEIEHERNLAGARDAIRKE